ncbi:MAG: hypothetical protein HY275_11080 [Gemmatimonadetes bacterium]|nr:hypothetical protein [Gemmatimonadota bacterium]
MLPRLRRLGAAALLAASAGCTEFLTVPNPTVIDAATINPVSDAPTLANSAQQNFATSFGLWSMYGAWFTGESVVAETFPTRNEFALRGIVPQNGSLNADVWAPLSTAIATARTVMGLALPTPATNPQRLQAAFIAAYSFELMAESFCQGTVSLGPQTPGPKLTVQNMLDSAIANFTIAITIGQAINTASSLSYANAALVGRARANLQRGNTAAAVTDANAVPAGFVFNLNYVDDLANRGRLANTFWQFTRDRGSISVDTAWRHSVGGVTTADPRVPWQDGATMTPSLSAQDANAGTFYVQLKFNGYGVPVRLASKLEADYIVAEASQNINTIATFINTRRTAFARPAYVAPATLATAIRDLMTEKGFDFFLEGHRMGDMQRNGVAAIAGMPVTGNTYLKSGFPAIGSQTCFPVPFAETSTNPNFP